ncbi:MAG: hypothetical protein KJ770_01005 [Actinobacteria bacterium]|nr:hypothetical protein [Actinomycetota bacterium]MCG2788512.1 hypothetical protein [Actinomycetes bacterium]
MENLIGNLKNFFSSENISFLWGKIYEWLEVTLKTLFGKIPYHPIRDLLINPWFWFIIIFLLILALIFRRR